MNITDRELKKFRPTDPDSYRQRMGSRKRGSNKGDVKGQKARWAKKHRKFHRPFIAWDGEGYTDPATGIHHYMMLVASTGDYLIAPEGRSLTTYQCFDLFLRVANQNPNCNHVIFGGSYDFNMILGQFSRQDAERLHKTGTTYFGRYRIEHRHRKSVSIRNRETDESIILYDVWPFFQTSFVKTLKAWDVVGKDIETIVSGKAERSRFEYANRQEILTYCKAELQALVALMEQFREGLIEAELTLNRWDGPGAVASALYIKHGTKEHKQDMTGDLEPVNRAAQRAYFGGRIEPVRFGNHEGPSWYYDINSAYPKAISLLPSLAGGTWKRSKAIHPKPSPLSLYRIRWDFTGLETEPFYPLPFRRKDGTIAFFPKGQGWYHEPEYRLLLDYFPPDSYKVLESYQFTLSEGYTEETAVPFQWVEEMYELRRKWKQEGRGGERILKLGLNSLYGKMVQQLGWRKDRGIPPYHQLEWGGYVTSYTRAELYRAAHSQPSAVVGFETDGIITTEPLPVCAGPALGEWGVESFGGVTYVQPGVYWLYDNGTWTPKHRGFDSGTLTRTSVLEGWENGSSHVTAKSTRFIGMGLALMEKDFRKWRRWETSDRELTIWPDNPKRWHPPNGCQGICIPAKGKGSRIFPPSPAHTLHTTELQWDDPSYWKQTESEPYPLAWRDNPSSGYTFAQMIAERDQNVYMEDL